MDLWSGQSSTAKVQTLVSGKKWAEQFHHLELQQKWKEQSGESLDRY
jgi:hypothetical protein